MLLENKEHGIRRHKIAEPSTLNKMILFVIEASMFHDQLLNCVLVISQRIAMS